MSVERFRLNVRLELKTDLHIAGPGRTLPLVDRSVEVDETGMPFIPASSFRGRLRAHLERLLKAVGEKVCHAPRPDSMCPHAGWPAFCRACRIFGSPWRLSAVTFIPLTLAESQRLSLEPLSFPLRTGVGINRRLNTVEEQRLFVLETVPQEVKAHSLVFEGQIEGWLEREDIGWLIAGLRTLTHLGGGKGRGLGRVQIKRVELIFYDESTKQWQPQDWEAILKEVKFGDST